MSSLRRLLIAVPLLAVVISFAAAPDSAHAATCADYPNQAAAQAAADTRDADGDGIYCESLPCPCSTGAPAPARSEPAPPAADRSPAPTLKPADDDPAGCTTPAGVQNITFSKTKYPHIRKHFLGALRKGWPRTLVLNRAGAEQRRNRLLEAWPTRPGYDRDEYPPAVGRGRGTRLTRGSSPRGWKADVQYVPSGENRSHGSVMGIKLRRFCSGTRFRYVFY